MYTYAAPRCLHDSEPAALGLRSAGHRGACQGRTAGHGLRGRAQAGISLPLCRSTLQQGRGDGQRFLASLPAPLLRAFLPGAGQLSRARRGPAASSSSSSREG